MFVSPFASIMLYFFFSVAGVSLAFQVPASYFLQTDQYSFQEEPFLVLPELKLLFCMIPKVACTQFRSFANEFNGIPHHAPGRASSWQELWHGDEPRLRSTFNDTEGWTRAVFLRDPMERLASGFKDKCLPPHWDPLAAARDCQNFPDADKHTPSVADFVSKLGENVNWHFALQQDFCFGMRDKIDKFDFVGLVSTDYKEVNQQVNDMLQLARSRLDNPDAVNATSLTALAQKHFAPQGPDMLNDHHNGIGSKEVDEIFQDASVRAAAEQFYAKDIEWIQSLNLKH
eukprot:TRINITY_DN809_c0_g1_i4.p1 TRINITY_DN809_c0_g1~~TRINITY_DN809_c0_g1_i4.p1  ORF type:complete len:286 (-),score=49.56 TRINITY_DN809_c0_g1_i4:54-911(-)